MNVPDELKAVLSSDPDVMSGAICFVGTRIPVSILLDNIRAGVPVDEFLDAYPDLTRSTIQAIIDWEDVKLVDYSASSYQQYVEDFARSLHATTV